MTLLGVEQFSRGISDRLAKVGPSLLKLRYPESDSWAAIARLCPGIKFILRPESEGLNFNEIYQGYTKAIAAAWAAGIIDQVVGYEIANEPNHPRNNLDPRWWAGEAKRALASFGEPKVPLLGPGLVPHVRVDEWRAVTGELPLLTGYGAHAYWQEDGPAAAVQRALASVPDGVSPERVYVTEFNAAKPSESYRPTTEQRAQECQEAVRLLRQAGVACGVLFALDYWYGEGAWGYSYSPSVLQQIIGTDAPLATVPTPAFFGPLADKASGLEWKYTCRLTPFAPATRDDAGTLRQTFFNAAYPTDEEWYGLLEWNEADPNGRVWVYWNLGD